MPVLYKSFSLFFFFFFKHELIYCLVWFLFSTGDIHSGRVQHKLDTEVGSRHQRTCQVSVRKRVLRSLSLHGLFPVSKYFLFYRFNCVCAASDLCQTVAAVAGLLRQNSEQNVFIKLEPGQVVLHNQETSSWHLFVIGKSPVKLSCWCPWKSVITLEPSLSTGTV